MKDLIEDASALDPNRHADGHICDDCNASIIIEPGGQYWEPGELCLCHYCAHDRMNIYRARLAKIDIVIETRHARGATACDALEDIARIVKGEP